MNMLKTEDCLSNCIGTRLLTPTKLNADFSIILHSMLFPPLTFTFPSTLQNTMARIYAEWFMTADYELAESLSFSFAKMNPDRQGHAYSEIWIPVVKKER